MGQKADLEKRLKNAQKHFNTNATTVTYSTVLNSKNPMNQLMPHFATEILGCAQIEQPTAEKTNHTSLLSTATKSKPCETNQSVTNTTEKTTSDVTQNVNEAKEDECVENNTQQILILSENKFKTPAIPSNHSNTMEISENESSESCAETDEFRAVKRGRGRPKKAKLDSSRALSPPQS